MLPFLLLLASAADLVPMRWTSPEPASLNLLDKTGINCLLLESANWRPDFVQAAKARQVSVFGVLRPGPDAESLARNAAAVGLSGVVLEGDFEDHAGAHVRAVLGAAKLTAIELPSRSRVRLDARPVVGTSEGVWPGIQAEENGRAHAAPSGVPWIHTNGGFLRFVRAAAPDAPVWIGNQPPRDSVITADRYCQAIADAAIAGARWVIALDADFSRRLFAREPGALRDWKKIAAEAAWFEAHPQWRSMLPLSELALVQDVGSGALYSGGVLDMIAVKHAPVVPVPTHMLSAETVKAVNIAVNVDPESLTPEQRSALRALKERGGRTVTGSASWKFPPVGPNRITLTDAEVKTLDDIWKEMNSVTGRRNLGARLFNVSSMLSNLLASADRSAVVLHLVNYSGFPAENVTVHLLGKYRSAQLLSPDAEPKTLSLFDTDEGSGLDVDAVGVVATIVLTR